MREIRIPDKLYFKIGEVAKLIGVEPYVLRYWETEFKEIEPIKSRSGQRLYRRKDVETIVLVRNLLYGDGYTIEGARRKVREALRGSSSRTASGVGDNQDALGSIRQELGDVVKILS